MSVRQYKALCASLAGLQIGFSSAMHMWTMESMGDKLAIHRICVKAKPARSHPEYYDWQTASVCMFVPENDSVRALEKARNELAAQHWEFLAYEDKSTLIEERVREVGGEVWEAFEQARQGRIFFRVIPDDFGAGNKDFRPILPARITESFMDRVIEDAGGRRLREDEKVPGQRNADYLIGTLIFELKDLQEEGLEKGQHQARVAELFRSYFPGEREVMVDPSLLSKRDYLKYLDIISRPIQGSIRSAAKQVKATRATLGREDLLGGLIFLNTGFGTFPHEAFGQQVERYAARYADQLSVVVSISIWSHTNGFESCVFYKFAPEEPHLQEVVALRNAFERSRPRGGRYAWGKRAAFGD